MALTGDASAVTLDLGALTFVETAGSRAVLMTVRQSLRNEGRLHLLRGSARLERVISESGVGHLLPSTPETRSRDTGRAMSQENIETLREALEAFNRRDKAAWLAVCDPEAENFPPREWPENAPICGAAAIWDFYVDSVKAWDDGSYAWDELIEAGTDKVVAHQQRAMRGKASGASVLWSYWVVFTFRDGAVIRSEWFADRTEAVEAAGLSE
jgi:ketosteroid isomerase-like protein